MRQGATVKLFQMVEAAEKAALKTLEKFRPRERSSGKEGMETQNPPKPAMMFWARKEVTAQEEDFGESAEAKLLLSDFKISACTLHWSLSAYC